MYCRCNVVCIHIFFICRISITLRMAKADNIFISFHSRNFHSRFPQEPCCQHISPPLCLHDSLRSYLSRPILPLASQASLCVFCPCSLHYQTIFHWFRPIQWKKLVVRIFLVYCIGLTLRITQHCDIFAFNRKVATCIYFESVP